MTVQIYTWVLRSVISWDVPRHQAPFVASVTILVAVVLIAFLVQRIGRRFIKTSVVALARRTEGRWDDMLAERGIFGPLSHLGAGLVFFTMLPTAFVPLEDAKDVIRRGSLVYMVLVTALVVDRLLTSLEDLYTQLDDRRHRPPIKSYAQVLKILNFLVVAILLVSIVLGQSPAVLLGGLGALSAVLLLVFKDPLLGLVASVQLSANDMIRRGDPIEVPKHGIEGEVIDMSLTMVKVQGADKSITTLPNYSLVNDSFRNLRSIREAGVRRVKRALHFDLYTVGFVDAEALKKLSHHPEVRSVMPDFSTRFRAGKATNLGVFRRYMEAWASCHQRVADGMALYVRQLAPGEKGVALELNCYLRELDYASFETMQAEIFEHLIAITPVFGLRIYQAPAGDEPAEDEPAAPSEPPADDL